MTTKAIEDLRYLEEDLLCARSELNTALGRLDRAGLDVVRFAQPVKHKVRLALYAIDVARDHLRPLLEQLPVEEMGDRPF